MVNNQLRLFKVIDYLFNNQLKLSFIEISKTDPFHTAQYFVEFNYDNNIIYFNISEDGGIWSLISNPKFKLSDDVIDSMLNRIKQEIIDEKINNILQ